MIDLHSHILPGIDDGSPDLETSLAMARMAVADGIRVMACTPHIYPGMFENERTGIEAAIAALRQALAEAGIPLQLVAGADTHLVPGLLGRLRAGEIPTLAGSAYLLLEPAHHVVPPGFEAAVFEIVAAGYVPVITHPERLTWIGDHYESFGRLVKGGAWMQITSGSLTGGFGSEARYWGERMLDEGLVHILASDAHGVGRRAPLLAEGVEVARRWVGREEAARLIGERPACILENRASGEVPAPSRRAAAEAKGLFSRWFNKK
ncbi:MAG: CpsB/CapC family capsule biosynthesis tyrosine phosphatase [Hydrogenophilaceae bacterium]